MSESCFDSSRRLPLLRQTRVVPKKPFLPLNSMINGPWPARVLLMMAALSASSCVSLEQSAPRVEMLPPSARLGSETQLAQGRDIYLTKCAKCHQVEPVRNYPPSKWQHEILPEMTDQAKLSAAESAAVRAYVMSVLMTPVG